MFECEGATLNHIYNLYNVGVLRPPALGALLYSDHGRSYHICVRGGGGGLVLSEFLSFLDVTHTKYVWKSNSNITLVNKLQCYRWSVYEVSSQIK